MASHFSPHLLTRTGAALLLALATATAQTPTDTVHDGATVRLAPPRLLQQFDVSAGTLQSIATISPALTGKQITVQLGGHEHTLLLDPFELRSPGFQLLVEDALGVHTEATPICTTYRGLVAETGDPVVASIVDGALTAIVYAVDQNAQPARPDWVVQPIGEADPTLPHQTHLVYRADDSAALPHQCGGAIATPVTPPAGAQLPTMHATRMCEIAIEADVEFYNANNSSVQQTQNDVAAVINQMDFIYDRDVDVRFTITTTLVTTQSVYTTNDAGNLLTEFRTRWTSTYGGIQRDIAHLFTGRSLNGSTIGVAYVGVVCSNNWGFGLSQSRFTGNFNSRVGLTAHEVGHNFNAGHCNSNGACYIMCSGLGGCNNDVTRFGGPTINTITGYASSSGCLSIIPAQPVISSITPPTMKVFRPNAVTLNGTGFTGALSYQIAGQTFTSGFSVPNDSTMSIAVPDGQPIGLTTVRVTNAFGTSNAMPLLYVPTIPPELRQTPLLPPTGGTVTMEFAGLPNHNWLLVLGLTPSTSPFMGFNLISNRLLLTAGVFPAVDGIDQLSIPVPAGLGFLTVYTQILQVDPLGTTPTGVSNVAFTIMQ